MGFCDRAGFDAVERHVDAQARQKSRTAHPLLMRLRLHVEASGEAQKENIQAVVQSSVE
jgi:hypothetical protein